MFVLASEITIGAFRFSGVNEVRITRSIHSIADSAVIKLPSIARVVGKGKATSEKIITGKQFKDGDPVTIKLGYNGDLKTEFSGFVRQRGLSMPLEVVCEGYSWLLRRNVVAKFWDSISVKDLLKEAVSGISSAYPIKVECNVDHTLSNVRANEESGFDVINSLSRYTDDCLCCFFKKPDTLWCGLVYTPYGGGTDVFSLGAVKYRLGYNVVKGNSLKERFSETIPVKVKYSKRRSTGSIIAETSDTDEGSAKMHARILNHIEDTSVLRALASEKAYQLNYTGYDGSVNAFLQPFAAPGYVAYIEDARYPEKNGNYLIEGVEVIFGINGARRIVEIGPKLGFANEKE